VTTLDYKGYWERVGYEDTPYVDISLPIYYSVASDMSIPELSTDSKSTLWPGLELILFPMIATIVIMRINRWKKRSS